jgi:hypothetical protein
MLKRRNSLAPLHGQQQLGIRHWDSIEVVGNTPDMVGGEDENGIPP